MFWFLFLIFFCILCFMIGWTTLGWILVIGFAVLGVFLIYAYNDGKKKEEEREEKLRLEKARKQAEKEKQEQIYNSEKEKLIEKYGEPDKTIVVEELNLSKEIIAFGKVNRIWLLGKDLPMGDIISCTFNDNQRIEKGKVSYETKTSTGNMAKRAVVGGVLLGGTGAVIGGATAKKNTVVNQENDKLIHDYTVIININSLSDPIIRIPLEKMGQR